MNLLRHARMQKKDDKNKSKTTKNYCGGIMGKSKQMAKSAPSCGFVQFGQDKTWTGMAGPFVGKHNVFVIF